MLHVLTNLRAALLVVIASSLVLVGCGSLTSISTSSPAVVMDIDQAAINNLPPTASLPEPPGYEVVQVPSSLDGKEQNVAIVVPQDKIEEPMGLVIYLHGWSVGYTDRRPDIEAAAAERGWLLAIPDYRGPFVNHCGNEFAQQDILDVVSWAKSHYSIDENRIYLVGFSGGGFMSLIMAHRHPEVWAAVSAWSGFGDLLVMYEKDKGNRYGASMRECFGGDPDLSADIRDMINERSPINHFKPGLHLPPLDLNGQLGDGLVPVQNSLRAFRALAPDLVSDQDIEEFAPNAEIPPGETLRMDPLSGRQIYLRRALDDLRVTVRPGNHEVLGAPAFQWFDQFTRR